MKFLYRHDVKLQLIRTLALAVLMTGFIQISSQAQQVIRGPYLQSPGQTSIILRWRTDSVSDSRVEYGPELTANMPYSAQDSIVTTEHRVKLTGLMPSGTYHYMIGNSDTMLLGPDSLMHFTTAPDTSVDTPIRLWAIGDFGHGSEGQQQVRDAFLDYNADHPTDLWLWLGDNAYQDGTDEEFQTKVFDTIYGYHDLMMHLPFASTSGNHDYNSICPWEPYFCTTDPYDHTGPYLDIIDPPTQGELGGVPSGLKLYYSFDYGNIHFTVLNSELGSLTPAYNWIGILNTDQNFTSPMLDWLKDDLAATTKTWKIVIWHQCPYSAQDNFTEENSVQQFSVATRHHFNPIIEQYGADMVLSGHDHNFQRTYLINGHYLGKDSFTPEMMINGTSGNASVGEAYIKYTNGPLKDKGTVYVVEGNASSGNSYSPLDHPAIYYGDACDTCLGSFIVDVDADTLTGRYLNSYGQILDEFSIIKSEWTTGTDNGPQSDNGLNVYPNPGLNRLFIEKDVPWKDIAEINLYSPIGQMISVPFSVEGSRIVLSTSNLASGVYLVSVTDASGRHRTRFVKD